MDTPTLAVDYLKASVAPHIKVTRLGYLRFERPDLDLAERFLSDFGLVTVHKSPQDLYLAANPGSSWCYHIRRSDQPKFLGFGFDCASLEDLQKLATEHNQHIEQGEELAPYARVILNDPNGFRVELNAAASAFDYGLPRNAATLNHSNSPERINAIQEFPAAPSPIVKLGHLVIETAGYEETVKWYTKTLGLIPSDTQVLPSGDPIVTFFRMDLADTPTDHHTIAIAHTFQAAFSHAAFETLDIDAIGAGQQWLRDRGWRHAWGIGRHVLGSQVFDYWSDPWGAHHEHYADGDVFTADHAMGVSAASAQAMSQWGQVMPAEFIKPKLTLKTLITLVKNLRKHSDLTVKKLAAIAKVMT